MTSTMAPENEVREVKRRSVSLLAGGSRLTLLAKRTRVGAETMVITTDIKTGKASRGMTTKHGSFESAVDALGELVREAVGRGWKVAERAGGFRAKPDLFDTMPQAPGASHEVQPKLVQKKVKRS